MSAFPDFANLGKIDRDFDEETPAADPLVSGEILDQQIPNAPSRLAAVAVIALTVSVATLFYYQVIQGGANFLLAERNRIRLDKIPAPRGVIFDRNSEPLVRNVASYQLVIRSIDLPRDKALRNEILHAVARVSQAPLDEIERTIADSAAAGNVAVIKANLSQDEALTYQTNLYDLAGVDVTKIPVRNYRGDAGLSAIVGYVGKPDQEFLDANPEYDPTALIGKTNVEKLYEPYLRGYDGQKRFEIDAQGRLQRVLASIDPRQGSNVVLSVDIGLQKILYESLTQSLADHDAIKGAAVAMNPQTGEILSLVSLPNYDNNVFSQGDNETIQQLLTAVDQPLLNRAIAGVYPSGSTIKPLWAAAATEEKLISETFKIDTPPEIAIGQFTFPDWRDHGVTDIKTAIAESNNIFFYGLTGGWGPLKGLGINKMVDYMRRFGFGEKTGVDLTGEQAGFVPTPAWKKKTKNEPWYIGDTYHLGIGQGDIAVTPLQLLVAQSAIVNGGKLIEPRVAQAVTDENGNEIERFETKIRRDNVFGDNARRVVKEGMRQTVTSGSARALNDLPVQAMAKTGTAQFGSQDKTHAWFVSFAPYNDPQIGIIVIVEGGGEGHAAALPVAKKALEWWFRK